MVQYLYSTGSASTSTSYNSHGLLARRQALSLCFFWGQHLLMALVQCESGISRLNTIPAGEFLAGMNACCSTASFCRIMLSHRPFSSKDSLLSCASQAWAQLPDKDRLDAIKAHPPIGRKKLEQVSNAGKSDSHTGGRSANWSSGEQKDVADSPAEVLSALEDGNNQYLDKFGFVFLICATGKSALEMLTQLQIRLGNCADREFKLACEELRKILNLRLEKLIDEYGSQ